MLKQSTSPKVNNWINKTKTPVNTGLDWIHFFVLHLCGNSYACIHGQKKRKWSSVLCLYHSILYYLKRKRRRVSLRALDYSWHETEKDRGKREKATKMCVSLVVEGLSDTTHWEQGTCEEDIAVQETGSSSHRRYDWLNHPINCNKNAHLRLIDQNCPLLFSSILHRWTKVKIWKKTWDYNGCQCL